MNCCFVTTGYPTHYYTLREAVGKLDDWAHLAEASHYRKLEDDIVTAQAQINSLRADIKGWTQAKELCEGCLTWAHTHGLVAHLEGQQACHIRLRGQVHCPHWKDGRGRPI